MIAQLIILVKVAHLFLMALLPYTIAFTFLALSVWILSRHLTACRVEFLLSITFAAFIFIFLFIFFLSLITFINPLLTGVSRSLKYSFQNNFCPAPTDECTLVPPDPPTKEWSLYDDISNAVDYYFFSVSQYGSNAHLQINYNPGFDGSPYVNGGRRVDDAKTAGGVVNGA